MRPAIGWVNFFKYYFPLHRKCMENQSLVRKDRTGVHTRTIFWIPKNVSESIKDKLAKFITNYLKND